MLRRFVLLAYRTVLLLHPRRVRLNHGAEMVAAVEAEWHRRAGEGARGTLAFTIWLAFDVVRSLPTYYVAPMARRVRNRSRRGRRQDHRRGGRERMHAVSQELRHSIRALMRNPGFTATAAITLALGIGANAAVFSVVDRVLLRPLPYPESENLVVVRHPVPGYTTTEWHLSTAGYFYFKENSRTLEDLGILRFPSVVLTGDEQAERVDAALITASVLTTLRVAPVLGRSITPEDDMPGAPVVVLLGHDLWTRRFGADPSIVGRTIMINGAAQEVVGVMPRGFHYPLTTTSIWRPLQLDPNRRAVNQHIYTAVGRLVEGADSDEAAAELRTFVSRFTETFPTAYSAGFMEESQFDVSIRTMLDDTVQNVNQALWIVLGTVTLLLLLACANVANLFLVQAEGRRREVALRTALGADRLQLLWHYLTESFVLATLGGVLGVAVAYAGVQLLTALAPAGLPRIHEIGVDSRTVTVALGLTVLSALFLGTFPLMQRGEANLTEHLKEGARSATSGTRQHRVRSGLVVSQMAIALLLLAASGLLFRSFLALRTVDLGFDPENVVTARLSVVRAKYEDNDAVRRFFETVRQRLESLPLVMSAGMVWQLEIVGGASDNANDVGDLPDGTEGRRLIDTKFASLGYFEAMGMRLVEGRFFERGDLDAATPGAIITRSMAEDVWPGVSAVGRRVRPLLRGYPWHTIVGVIEDVHTEGVKRPAEATVYFPYTDINIGSMAFVIRSGAPMSAILSALQREVWAIDPDVPIAEVTTMEQIVADDLASTTFTLSLLGLASAIALLLGAVGIYGVISYSVTQRAPEIGIRLALGARGGQVGSMILGQTMRLAVVGIGVGLVAALALNRVMNSVLFGVQSTDPLTFVIVCVLLAAVAAVAGFLPAMRAARVDPLEALRAE